MSENRTSKPEKGQIVSFMHNGAMYEGRWDSYKSKGIGETIHRVDTLGAYYEFGDDMVLVPDSLINWV